MQLELPGPSAGGAEGVRAVSQPRAAARGAHDGDLGELAAALWQAAVGGDPNRVVPSGRRRPNARQSPAREGSAGQLWYPVVEEFGHGDLSRGHREVPDPGG